MLILAGVQVWASLSPTILSHERTQMGNKGAFIRFTAPDMTPQFTTFAASPHPDVRPMAYAAGMFGRLLGM